MKEGEEVTKYAVTLMTVASVVIEVEAEDEEAAVEAAFEKTPSPAWDWPDMGEWSLPSEIFPDLNKPEDDISVVD